MLQNLTNIATIFTLLFGFIQFCSFNQDQKIDKTFEKNRIFYEGEVSAAWKKTIINPEVVSEITSYSFLPVELKKDIFLTILKKKVSESETELQILINYYSSIKDCISANVCSKNYVDRFLLSEARSFFRNYKSYMCNLKNAKKADEEYVKELDFLFKFYTSIEMMCD